MTRATRLRLVCAHEAGHALARWYFGHHTHRVIVLTVEDVKARRWATTWRGSLAVSCEGFTDGPGIHNPPYGLDRWQDHPEMYGRIVAARDQDLVTICAGVTAEAAYRRCSLFDAQWRSGGGDGEDLSRILDGWFSDPDERSSALMLAQQRATALVRSKPGSAAIKAVADVLMEKGEVAGTEIAALCRAAYGGRECQFGAWDECWPPTLAQIRAGFIPEDRRRAA